MDKRVIFAVAGSGKTSHIVSSLSSNKRSLILTYTDSNYENISRKILKRCDGVWPTNVTLLTYFGFLYKFCYRPFLSDNVGARGIIYDQNPNRWATQADLAYYVSQNGYLYSNRLSLYLEKTGVIDNIINRIQTYFDEFIIDEIQDIGGRDFSFLEKLMAASVDMLFVGDFYQHTYDTSRDGNVNRNLFGDKTLYEKRFTTRGFECDCETLVNSWRCGKAICDYITTNLGIRIDTNREPNDNSAIRFISDRMEVEQILRNDAVIKLHYQNSAHYGKFHKNWGDTKGEDCYTDVCVMLNKSTMAKYTANQLPELPILTRNKLYVAITRAHGNCYLIDERMAL